MKKNNIVIHTALVGMQQVELTEIFTAPCIVEALYHE